MEDYVETLDTENSECEKIISLLIGGETVSYDSTLTYFGKRFGMPVAGIKEPNWAFGQLRITLLH